jgi:hypothetical protein
MNMKLLPALALATALVALPARAATDAAGAIDFGKFSPGTDAQFVEVDIKSNLINMVARLAEKSEPEVAKFLRNIQGVRVNVIGLTDDNRDDTKTRIESVRSQLSSSGWDRIVTVKDGGEDVGVFVKLRGEEAIEGIVVTIVSGEKEAVFVNIVGNIKPEQIAKVGETLHIEPLKEIGRKLESQN